jgi:hypothetical protein
LYVVNAPANCLEIYAIENDTLRLASSVSVGLEPVAVAEAQRERSVGRQSFVGLGERGAPRRHAARAAHLARTAMNRATSSSPGRTETVPS